MHRAASHPQPVDARLQILDAAHRRFSAYGFGKTTMAEIADDVGMSAANLYRYFENKLDLGAAAWKRSCWRACASPTSSRARSRA
jgi:AcrR family transcriptional regulator